MSQEQDPRLQSIVNGASGRMAEQDQVRLQSIVDGITTRMVERQEAINQQNGEGEQAADQKVVEELRDAAFACPPQSPGPEAKEKFEAIATNYEQSKNRGERDHIILHNLVPIVKLSHKIPLLLFTVTALSVKAIAPDATLVTDEGQTIDGVAIDNDDGTHKFLYDADGDGVLDHETIVDDKTNKQIGEAEEMGLMDIARDFFEAVGDIFS
ncbi:hypothetical protein B0J17DRAFT_641412 [Rhizoctonia solani]|nr:hypothetical protein B0J17DRAFT_641412 [Rhizoctonia solani]